MKQFLLLVFSLFLTQIYAHGIKGVIKENGAPVSYANVVLHDLKDTSVVKFTYSDDGGSFNIENISSGLYFVKITYVGLADFVSPSIAVTDQDIDLGEIELKSNTQMINEVTVTAKKPLMEVKPDKIVLNVAGSVLATGDDALSLLRKSPGVMVDNNENITLLGKSGLVIYIDGKPSPLSSTELANMLKNMSSNDIESIEIISNPSAKYEAQGTAGIINIKRKRQNNSGFNGTANLTARQGLTQAINTGLGLNYRNDKLNVASNFGVYRSENYNYNHFYRTQNGLGFITNNENNNDNTGLNSKINADYYLNKKSTIGFIVEYNQNDFKMTNTAETRLGNQLLTEVDSLLVNNGFSKEKSKTTNINTNYYFDGGNETTFNVDLNFGRYDRTIDNFTPNHYYNADRSVITSKYEIRNITPTIIDIYTFKADYERKLGKGKFSTGLKSALVNTDNTFNFYNIQNGLEKINQQLSNRFYYDEFVNAGYMNYNIQLKKLGINTGIRLEKSNTKGNLETMIPANNKVVENSYINLFPSAAISYMVNDKHQFQLSYGRRINRPNYQDLNPFEFQLDQLTFEKGNPFLKPEYTDNIQLVHTFSQKITTTLSYSHTSDVITRIVDTSGVKGSFITWDNIAFRKVYSVGIGVPLSITEKWSTYSNINGVHTYNNADFGNNKVINLNVTSFNIFHQQSFVFPKNWSGEVSGWYSSPSIWEGTFVMRSMWAVGAGVSKKFAGNKGKLTLSIDDIFKSNIWKGESTFGGLFMDVSGGWDSRRVRLSCSYTFGKQAKGKNVKRARGFDEEQNRIKKS